MSGVFEFEDEVSRYEVKMKKEIVELIDQGKLDAEKREEVFRGIFNRIVNEAKGKHEPFAERVPISVKNQYGISNLTKMFQLHSHKPTINYSGAPVQLLPEHQASRPRGSDKWTAGNIGKAVWQTFTNLMPTNNGGEGENAQGPHLIEELAAIVNSNVKNVKKYDDVFVLLSKMGHKSHTKTSQRCSPHGATPPNHLHTNSIRVREYIFYNYQYQLVDYFKAHGYRIVKCPPRVMPASYDHSLDSLWNTIQNKLGDSFSQIEHTLKDMNSS